MGPFEEEEEGTGIASDVVKVEGAESGHPRFPDSRNDTGTAIFPISGQQNKATHTHSPVIRKNHRTRLRAPRSRVSDSRYNGHVSFVARFSAFKVSFLHSRSLFYTVGTILT